MKVMAKLATATVFSLALVGAASSGQILDSAAVQAADASSVPAGPSEKYKVQGLTGSADEYNFLELFYYGPDDDYYEIYDLWDLLPDREGDSRDSEPEERDGQERDARD